MATKATTTTAQIPVTTSNTVVIPCSIKSIQVYDSGDSNIRYRAMLDVEIDAMKKDTESGDYIVSRVNYIDFVPRVLIAQCINMIDGLDLMYTKKKETAIKNGNSSGFGAAELQVVLRNAKLEIERTKFEAGDEYTISDGTVMTHEHEGYNTNINAIKVSDRVQNNLDNLIDSVFIL